MFQIVINGYNYSMRKEVCRKLRRKNPKIEAGWGFEKNFSKERANKTFFRRQGDTLFSVA